MNTHFRLARAGILNFLSGIALLLNAGVSHATLITNGGFESGLADWSCDTPAGNCGVSTFGGPQEGARHFYGYDNGPGGVLSQILNTDIGSLYSLSFSYGSSSSSPQNNLSVDVGDFSEIFSFASSGWRSLTTTFTALSTTTELSYFFDTNSGTGTLWLDGITVNTIASAVPEPSSLALLALGLGGLVFSRKLKTV